MSAKLMFCVSAAQLINDAGPNRRDQLSFARPHRMEHILQGEQLVDVNSLVSLSRITKLHPRRNRVVSSPHRSAFSYHQNFGEEGTNTECGTCSWASIFMALSKPLEPLKTTCTRCTQRGGTSASVQDHTFHLSPASRGQTCGENTTRVSTQRRVERTGRMRGKQLMSTPAIFRVGDRYCHQSNHPEKGPRGSLHLHKTASRSELVLVYRDPLLVTGLICPPFHFSRVPGRADNSAITSLNQGERATSM